MRLSLLLLFIIFFFDYAQSQENLQTNSIGIVFNVEFSNNDPAINQPVRFRTLGLEYQGRFNQIGIRSGFRLSNKINYNYNIDDLVFIDILLPYEVRKTRFLEIPVTVQYYPRFLRAKPFQPYLSAGASTSFGQDMIYQNSLKNVVQDATFWQVSALGILINLANHFSFDLQGYFKTPLQSPKYQSERKNAFGLQTKLNFIF